MRRENGVRPYFPLSVVKVFSGRVASLPSAHDLPMGRIGKSYPRFQPSEPHGLSAPEERRISGLHVFGALVGVIAALSLIGFLLTR
jgi:hypothetical protein